MLRELKRIAGRGRRNELLWRYGFNFAPTVNYRFRHAVDVSEGQRAVVEQLSRDGIAITSVEEASGKLCDFEELNSCVKRLMEDRNDELNALRRRANDGNSIGEKTFNVELLGSPLQFDPASIYARFALQDYVRDIANAYLGMCAELRYYNVWNTFPASSEARESQLWHYDREDNFILKMFLYLDDVDLGAGPFTYAPGTHRKGKYRFLQPEFIMEGNVRRTTDEQMDQVYPREEWRVGTGKKGTIIFADTRGFHKGGEARTKDRLMFTCMYTSRASQSKDLIHFPMNFDPTGLSREQLRALRIPRK